MKRRNVVVGFSLITAVLFAGCATYDPVASRGLPLRPDPSGANVGKATRGDLTILVEEHASEKRSQEAFDTKLAEEGVLPLLIQVENAGQEPYEVKATDIIVRGAAVLKSFTPEEAASKAERSAVGRALGWSLIVPIIGIPIGVVASAMHTSRINKQLVQDFAAKGFQDGIITPRKERAGFLFFELDKGRKDLSGLSLEMTAKNVVTGESVTITAPLPAATFTPKREASEKPSGEHRW
jgi:hypothetical protein